MKNLRQFEYKTLLVMNGLEESLNYWGSQGWEAIGSYRSGPLNSFILLKKEII